MCNTKFDENIFDSDYIDLSYLIYNETEKTILMDECQNILFDILIEEVNNSNDYSDDENDKVKRL